MDNERPQKRPTERGKTTVSRERPQSPASRPRAPRPQSGTAAEREAQRRQRQAEAEAWAQERLGRSAGRELPEEPLRSAARREESGRSGAASRAGAQSTPRRRAKAGPVSRGRDADADPFRVRAQAKPGRPPAAGPRPERQAPAEKAAPRRRGRKPHRVYNTNFGFKFAIMLAVVAVIVLSMIIFFKVKHIEVILPEGENGRGSYYTAEEIIAASGVNLDDNLLSLSKATVASRIHAALPYVNEIQIKKQLPGTGGISFTEFEVTYGIQDETGAWWLMSREGRILTAVEEQEAKTHLRVTGMPIQKPQVGESFKPAATEGADMSEIAAKQRVVLEVIPALEQTDYVKKIDRVDVSTSYDLTLWWKDGQYEVRLGTTEQLDYKLRFLQATLDSSEIQNRSGTIDLTFNEDNKVHFLEFR